MSLEDTLEYQQLSLRSRVMFERWECIYQDAMLETNNQKLAEKINIATGVLESRLSGLGSSPDDLRQKQRIEDALRTLDAVRRIELKASA